MKLISNLFVIFCITLLFSGVIAGEDIDVEVSQPTQTRQIQKEKLPYGRTRQGEIPSYLDRNINCLCDCRPELSGMLCGDSKWSREYFRYNVSPPQEISKEENCGLLMCGLMCLPINCVWRTLTCPFQDSVCCCDVICARCQAHGNRNGGDLANKFSIRLYSFYFNYTPTYVPPAPAPREKQAIYVRDLDHAVRLGVPGMEGRTIYR